MKSRSRPIGSADLSVEIAGRVPLATQISRQITRQVAAGRIAAGSHLPSMADLAKHLGVNVHTVRAAYRQLADDGIVSMNRGARTRVLGYDRRLALSGHDAHASFTVGVMVPAFSMYFGDYLEALTKAAELEGWLPIICRTQGFAPDVVSRYMDQLFSRNVDGIILINFEKFGDEEVVETLASSGRIRPFVLVDSADVGVGSRIIVDHAASARRMVSHLIEHGHSRIACLGAPEDWSLALSFKSGYEDALATAGLPVDERLAIPVEEFSLDAGAKAAMQLLQRADPPSAVTCAGDVVAFGAIAAAREMGVRVPEDLAVMGYGGNPLTPLDTTPLSTVQIPADRLGWVAIGTLRRAIDENEAQPPRVVDTTLVRRESCGCGSR